MANTWKEHIAELRQEWTGKLVKYQGAIYTVLDVDYNGALLINRETIYNSTTAILPGMLDKEE